MKKVVFFIITLFAISAFGKDIAIIVNKSNPMNSIKQIDLKRIYLSDKMKWDDGKTILALTLSADDVVRKSFQKVILGMNGSDLKSYYSDQQIKGKNVKKPSVQKSSLGLGMIVKNVPFAIGYISIDDVKKGAVKILKVDGKLPGEAGYPIK